jgi:hypothetical protein
MTEFFVNGEQVEDEEAFNKALDEAQEYMVKAEKLIQDQFDVSGETASAIFYLRGRSRWTPEKEIELIERDHSGYPIPLGQVLSGEF